MDIKIKTPLFSVVMLFTLSGKKYLCHRSNYKIPYEKVPLFINCHRYPIGLSPQ